MPTSNENTHGREVERLLYESDRFVRELLPQTDEEVREAQTLFGTTPITMPERLRSSRAVLERIKQGEPAETQLPSAFGRLLTMLRTEKRLSIAQLAEKTALSTTELCCLESDPTYVAKPLAVSALARYFRLQPGKLAQIAGLTCRSEETFSGESLQVAACAKPSFDQLSRQEKRVFHQFLRQLR